MFGFSYDGHTEHEQKLLSASLEIYLVFQELSKIAKASNPKYVAHFIVNAFIMASFHCSGCVGIFSFYRIRAGSLQ